MRLNELEMKIAVESEALFQKTYETSLRFFGQPVAHFRQLDNYYDTSDCPVMLQNYGELMKAKFHDL